MSGRRSRDKGARGERAVIDALERQLGIVAVRTQGLQSGDKGHLGDVWADHPFFQVFHVEVKNDEQITQWAALKQATEDAEPGKYPVVFMHRNNKPWIVVMNADHWIDMQRGEWVK